MKYNIAEAAQPRDVAQRVLRNTQNFNHKMDKKMNISIWKKYKIASIAKNIHHNIYLYGRKTDFTSDRIKYEQYAYSPIVIHACKHHLTRQIWPSETLYTLGIKLYEQNNSIDIIIVHNNQPWQSKEIIKNFYQHPNLTLIQRIGQLPPNTMIRLVPESHSQHARIQDKHTDATLNIYLHTNPRFTKNTPIHHITNIEMDTISNNDITQILAHTPNGYRIYALRIEGHIVFFQCNSQGKQWTIFPTSVQI